MMKRGIVILFFAIIFTGLCAAQSMFRNFHQEGPASQDSASMEMAISHPSLPLGTQIRVTNPRNNKQVTAKITGRIPATEGRIADVSKGVAEALELSSRARNPVVLDIANDARATPPPEQDPEPPPPPEQETPEPPEPDPEPETPEPEIREPVMAEEEPPLLPPPEDSIKEVETVYIAGEDPEPPSITTTDSKNQTTSPVAAQSPNITIYNVMGSPNSFATDSAPVNTGGNGTSAGPGTDGTQQQGSLQGALPIIAAAPSATVSTSERKSTSSTGNNNSSTQTPPAESGKPAVATATAQIVAPIQPQASQKPVQVQIPQAPQEVQPRQTPPVPQVQQQSQPQQQTQSTWQIQQPWQPQQPRPVEVSPLPPIVDRGTALIRPYMPSADSRKIYRVQVGSYKNTWHARETFDRLTSIGFRPWYEGYGEYVRVVIPGVPAASMPTVARLLGKVGFTEALIREEN
jgi:rare lipoprotein A